VVFVDGRPRPAEYRRFRIKGVAGQDDYAMLQEVLRRPQFRLSPEGVEDLLSFGQEALLILPDADEGAITSREGDLKDKEDAAVWAGFEASGADSLITGDKELLQKVRGARRTRTVLDDLRAGRLRPGKEDPPPSP